MTAADEIIGVGTGLYRAGLVAGRAGNVSVRVAARRALVTAAGTHKGRLTAADLVECDLDGDPHPRASTEWPTHRACYLASERVQAVIHAHAPALTAAGLLRLDLAAALPELHLAVGAVVTVEFLASGSDLLAHAVGRAVAGGAAVVLLAGHGALAVGGSLEQAHDRLELAELSARAVVMGR